MVSDPIVNFVMQKMMNRSITGMKTYGVSMARTDVSTLEWLNHAQQEAMDLAVYLERIIQDLTKEKAPNISGALLKENFSIY